MGSEDQRFRAARILPIRGLPPFLDWPITGIFPDIPLLCGHFEAN